jgi:WD40 repeat protein
MKRIYIIIFSIVLFCTKTIAQTMVWTKKANPANQSINSIVFNNTGTQVLSGTNCHPASIRIYNKNTGAINWDYTVGEDYLCIMGVTFSSNAQYIATIEEFGNIFLFSNSSTLPIPIDTINIGTQYAFSIAIAPNNLHLAVGGSNNMLKLYEISSGKLIKEFNTLQNWVTSVAFSIDGKFILSGGSDNRVKIWNMDGTIYKTLSGHTDDITQVKVTPDNLYVLSSSKDNTIKMWDFKTGELLKTFTVHNDDVNGFDISSNGKMVVTASSDETSKIFNINDGSILASFGVKDSGAINTVAWSPTENFIVTGNSKSDVVLWDLSAKVSIKTPNEIETNITISPNPAYGFITINGNKKFTEVQIIDNLGELILHANINDNKIDVSKLSNGLYYIKLFNSDGDWVCEKIIKQ